MKSIQCTEQDIIWWKNKIMRRGGSCFNRVIAKWAIKILDKLITEAKPCLSKENLDELAGYLEVPRKYLTRAIATLTRCGLITADLQSRPSFLIHFVRLSGRKAPAQKVRRSIPKSFRKRILDEDGYLCAHCQNKFEDKRLQIDHIIPVSLLGADEPGNWVMLCDECNADKLDRFERDHLNLFRKKSVQGNIQLRFKNGFFWPVINGRIQTATREKWNKKP